MGIDLRKEIQKIEKAISKNNPAEAFKIGINAISKSDSDNNYLDSIALLNRLVEYTIEINDRIKIDELKCHIVLRYLIEGDSGNASKIISTLEDEIIIPVKTLTLSVFQSHMDHNKQKYHLMSLEKQSIFGDYYNLDEVPLLNFNSENDAFALIEEFFPSGRYLVNLIQLDNSLHQNIKLDIGDFEEVNVVENKRILRIK